MQVWFTLYSTALDRNWLNEQYCWTAACTLVDLRNNNTALGSHTQQIMLNRLYTGQSIHSGRVDWLININTVQVLPAGLHFPQTPNIQINMAKTALRADQAIYNCLN